VGIGLDVAEVEESVGLSEVIAESRELRHGSVVVLTRCAVAIQAEVHVTHVALELGQQGALPLGLEGGAGSDGDLECALAVARHLVDVHQTALDPGCLELLFVLLVPGECHGEVLDRLLTTPVEVQGNSQGTRSKTAPGIHAPRGMHQTVRQG